MKYKWRILYYPPHHTTVNNDPDTWRKVFLFTKFECKEELDLQVKIRELINDYNMNEKYIIIEDLETKESHFYYNNKPVSFGGYSFIEFDNQ